LIAAEWTCSLRKAVSGYYTPAGDSIGGLCAAYHTFRTDGWCIPINELPKGSAETTGVVVGTWCRAQL